MGNHEEVAGDLFTQLCLACCVAEVTQKCPESSLRHLHAGAKPMTGARHGTLSWLCCLSKGAEVTSADRKRIHLEGMQSPFWPCHVGAKYGWRLAWETMMKELAPQTKDGSYSRPTYNLKGVIGNSEFPVCSSLQLHNPFLSSDTFHVYFLTSMLHQYLAAQASHL